MTGSTNNVTDNTTDVKGLYRDPFGNMYMDIQVTVEAGTGGAPEPAGVHVYRIPVQSRIS